MNDPREGGVSEWYVGQSPGMNGFDGRAVSAITEMGFRCFRPLRMETCFLMKNNRPVFENGHRKKTLAPRALFPGYWFVAFDVDKDPWGPILQIKPWVVRLVGMSRFGRPSRVTPGFVEAIQSVCGDDDALPLGFGEKQAEPLELGTIGTCLVGALTSFPATVACDMGDRIIAESQIFGRTVRHEMAKSDFQVAA